MEQSAAIQQEIKGLKPSEANGQAAPSIGTAPTPAPAPAASPLRQGLVLAADLRITVVLFVLAMCLVFWGTLAQVDHGVNTVVARYFRSAFVFVPLKVVSFLQIDSQLPIPFPGGWLIGGAMLVNLLAAHAVRFKLAWNRAGILLIHSGLIVIMLGELITGLFAVEGQMPIQIGQTTSEVMHPGTAEFVVIRTLDDKTDEVIAVPKGRLKTGAVITDANLPFKIEITEYMNNSEVRVHPRGAKISPNAKGHARLYFAKDVPEVSGVDPNARHDVPTINAILTGPDGANLGTWMFSAHLENQFIKIGDKEYQLALRYKHTKRPYTMHLTDFKHDVFPGTNTPKDFHSYISLHDPETGVDRDVEIFMNAPLYYRGETFYQQSWTTDKMTGKANGTVLQVVHNPGWLMPYLACLLVGVGLLLHFGNTLYKFVDRRMVR